MASENAKKLAAMLLNANEDKIAKVKADPAAFIKESGLECSEKDFFDAWTLNRPLDNDELESITGGSCGTIFGAKGNGGCRESTYLIPECDATVEEGSWCNLNDWCAEFSSKYSEGECFFEYVEREWYMRRY